MNKTTVALVIAVLVALGGLIYFGGDFIKTKVPEAKEAPVVAPAPVVVSTPTPEAPTVAKAPMEVPSLEVAPAVVASKMSHKSSNKSHNVSNKTHYSPEATAYLQAFANRIVYECLSQAIDLKIQGDLDQNEYRDFGNIVTTYRSDPREFIAILIYTEGCTPPEFTDAEVKLIKGADKNALKFN